MADRNEGRQVTETTIQMNTRLIVDHCLTPEERELYYRRIQKKCGHHG